MNSHQFYLVDVFAETKYSGNQLAVVRNAAGLSDDEMQNIAREMNLSETTFILSDREKNDGYDVRIFSLHQELPFAGHPTLGTAFVIQQFIVGQNIPLINLNLPAGRIPVTFNYDRGRPDILWMRQLAPEFGEIFEHDDLAKVLNIESAAIDQHFPVETVSTGLPFIIVPLRDLDAVRSCRVDRSAYLRLIEQAQAKSILVFCPEAYNPSNQINVRMFDDYHGISEDAATGSANGCLAAYLVKNRYFKTDHIDLRVEQGYEIGRPSLLLLKAKDQGQEGISVSVGGRVIMVAQGELV